MEEMSDQQPLRFGFRIDVLSTSASTAKLDEALAKAQGVILVAPKNAKNPGFKRGNTESTYADLASIWSACRKPLSDNGISVTQWPIHSTDSRVHLMTRLAHAGEWMMAEFSIPAVKSDPQGYGSATTYIKRFALSSIVGVYSADEDDDGNAAVQEPKMSEQRMSETLLADHLAAIETASDLELLKEAYFSATKAAGRDQPSLQRIIFASTARKLALAGKVST